MDTMFGNDWDQRYVDLARFVASWSKDPSTQVGAVILDADRQPVSFGFNGLPMGVDDTAERLNDRDLKYKMIVHAERNALVFARRTLKGCTLYTWPFLPCPVCAGMFIQAKIARVVAPVLPERNERWTEDIALSLVMFEESGVAVTTLKVGD